MDKAIQRHFDALGEEQDGFIHGFMHRNHSHALVPETFMVVDLYLPMVINGIGKLSSFNSGIEAIKLRLL